jgi:N6-adenosine-specific RNA methylase IME4
MTLADQSALFPLEAPASAAPPAPRDPVPSLDDLPLFGFDCIVADPPWHLALWSEKGEGKAPQAHYKCLSTEIIAQMRVNDHAARDCWLFLWATNPMLRDAFSVLDSWGFRYVTSIAWRKTTVNGKDRWGPGYVARTIHEPILIGKVGEPRMIRAIPGLFPGRAREHSRKPDEFYDLLSRFLPRGARVLDLFSRTERPGITAWGDETGKFEGTQA